MLVILGEGKNLIDGSMKTGLAKETESRQDIYISL